MSHSTPWLISQRGRAKPKRTSGAAHYQIWSHADFLQHFSDFWPTSNQSSGQRCVLNTNVVPQRIPMRRGIGKYSFFSQPPCTYAWGRPVGLHWKQVHGYTSFWPYNVFWVCCGTQYTDARHLHLQVLETEAPSALAVKRLLNPICLTSSSWWTFISSTHHAVRSASS